MKHYKENTLKTYANKLTNKFKNECDFVVATTDIHSELVIGAMVNYKNNGIKSNRYDVTIWTLENGNINIEIYKNDDRLKCVYKEIEVTSLNYALDVIYDIISNDNSDEIEKLENEETNIKETEDAETKEPVKSIREVDKVCGDCSHFNACMQGNQTVAPTCCMFDSLYNARKNPNWHHVSLNTLANIDRDMLDEKRQCYMYLYHLLKDFRKYAVEISRREVYFDLVRNVTKDIQQMYFNNRISIKAYNYASRHIEVVSVEKNYFQSKSEQAFGYKESKRYSITLR